MSRAIAEAPVTTLSQARGRLVAAARFAGARLRGLGFAGIHPHWHERAARCERCPLRVVQCGISYCGKPYLQQMDRDLATEGCGCPCRDKAKDPAEHCPIDQRHHPAGQLGGRCTCKWCG